MLLKTGKIAMRSHMTLNEITKLLEEKNIPLVISQKELASIFQKSEFYVRRAIHQSSGALQTIAPRTFARTDVAKYLVSHQELLVPICKIIMNKELQQHE